MAARKERQLRRLTRTYAGLSLGAKAPRESCDREGEEAGRTRELHELVGEAEAAVVAQDRDGRDVAVRVLGRVLVPARIAKLNISACDREGAWERCRRRRDAHLCEDVADYPALVVLGDERDLGPREAVVEVCPGACDSSASMP